MLVLTWVVGDLIHPTADVSNVAVFLETTQPLLYVLPGEIQPISDI